ncbi:MAG: OmpA family protein, partial [Microthrixaceae bacterium]|nr:OmpA family protein [Microthrixaceae bacterium]
VVEFDTGSAALNPQWEATVNEVAQLLVGNTAKLQVAGHTDDVGDAAKNQALSEQRANTIRDALVARGVAADRLTTAGFGPTRPIADNATDEGRQRNRRIEFVVAAR